MAWPRLIVAGLLGIAAGFAAAWSTSIALLIVLSPGIAEFPTYVGPLTGVAGVLAGIGVFVGVSRSLRQDLTDERSIWNRPPGLVFGLTVSLVCLWMAVLLTDFSDFDTFFFLLLGAGLLLILGAVWLVRLIVLLARRRFALTGPSIARWLVGPTAVLVLMLFGSWDGRQHLRFEMSESALASDADQRLASVDEELLAEQGAEWVDSGQRIGVLEVDSVTIQAVCTSQGDCDPSTASVEYSMNAGIFSTYTYIYSPAGQPEASAWGIEHLGGPWWFREFHD